MRPAGILSQRCRFLAGMESSTSTERSIISRTRHPLVLSFSVIVAPTLWIVFVGSAQAHELLLGGVASAVTVLFVIFVSRSCSEDLTLRSRDVLQVWRVPWSIVSGVWEVTLVAFKDLLRLEPAKSLYRVCGFDTSTHDPVRKARTVLAIAYTTAGPNFIVLGVDPAQSRMLFHQIESGPVPKMTKALGAKS